MQSDLVQFEFFRSTKDKLDDDLISDGKGTLEADPVDDITRRTTKTKTKG